MPSWNINFSTRVDLTDPHLVGLLAEAKALARVIRKIPITPRLQQRLDRLNIMRAVRGTTGIEGSDLTEDEVSEVLAGTRTGGSSMLLEGKRKREVREVRNAADLMGFVETTLATDPSSPLTEELIRDFHHRLTSGIRYDRNVPGHYRSHPVTALSYLPPSHSSDIRRLMREFIGWFNEGRPKAWDPIVQAIVAHFYVISIHPFGDGNGRTSRAVESFLLYRAGVNARGFYSLSNFYYQNRSEYVETLDRVRFETDPDLTPFVRFAVIGLVDELRIVHDEVLDEVRIIAFRDYAREAIGQAGKLGSPVGARLLNFMFMLDRTSISVRKIRHGSHPISQLYEDVVPKTLARDLKLLRELRLIRVEGDALVANLAVLDQFTATMPIGAGGG